MLVPMMRRHYFTIFLQIYNTKVKNIMKKPLHRLQKKNCLICKVRNCTWRIPQPILKFWSRMYVSFFVVRSRVAEHLGARGRVELIKFDSNLPPPSSSFCEAIVSFSWACNWPFKLTSEDVRTEKKQSKEVPVQVFLDFLTTSPTGAASLTPIRLNLSLCQGGLPVQLGPGYNIRNMGASVAKRQYCVLSCYNESLDIS